MKKGFTLIELLVVLVIIGILIGLILPNTLKAIDQAHDKECASNLRSIDTAIQMCYSETKDWTKCDDTDKLKKGGFLETIPVCPLSVDYSTEVFQNGQRTDKSKHFSVWPPVGPHIKPS